jgi:hypothetical protein
MPFLRFAGITRMRRCDRAEPSRRRENLRRADLYQVRAPDWRKQGFVSTMFRRKTMTMHHYPEESTYILAILHPKAPKVGSFLMAFCEACVRADIENYELLRPALKVLMKKYPCDIQRQAVERLI